MTKDEIWTIDFEASSLNLNISYPVEVGYTNGKIEREFLIRPMSWWFDWNEESAAIHGIEQYELITKGTRPEEVCVQMNEDLKGKKVWCDGGMYDQHWNFVLFDACGMKPDFLILHRHHPDFDEKGIKHRALDDAKQLYNYIRQEKIELAKVFDG